MFRALLFASLVASTVALAGCGKSEPERSTEELTKMQAQSQNQATDDERQMIKERDKDLRKKK